MKPPSSARSVSSARPAEWTAEHGNGSGEQRPVISLRGVSKAFPLRRGHRVTALDDLSFEVRPEEFVALIGPSGCGKSTILRLIASLEASTSGTVLVEGRPPADLAREHRLGVAFQDHALLPWLSAWDNVALPYRVAGRRPDRDRIAHLLQLVGMTGFERARPRQLSGGMRQRVAIARALVLDPDVLLLDEPFGALDAVTRRHLNVELQRIWAESRITTLLVTHSVDEALFLADRVIVLSSRPGRVRLIRELPFVRPRDRSIIRTPEFHALADELTAALDEITEGP